jgi:RNA polymerase primary sigma factor
VSGPIVLPIPRRAPARAGASGGDSLDSIGPLLIQIARVPLLTAAQELELARRIERGDLEAKEELVRRNLRLVVSIARRYPTSTDMSLADLVQEGVLGLIRAAEKFDWRRGHRFSTYATLWIRQAIGRALQTRASVIRFPEALHRRSRRVAATRQTLLERIGRVPTPDELAAATGLSVQQIEAVEALPRVVMRLDAPAAPDADVTAGELLAADAPGLAAQVGASLERRAVRAAVEGLAEPLRSVIELRYGLGEAGDEPMSYLAIGERLGLGRGHVRLIERRALAQLARHPGLDERPAA